jgi:hypothetical protein
LKPLIENIKKDSIHSSTSLEQEEVITRTRSGTIEVLPGESN